MKPGGLNPPFIAVALISACALAYEVLLTRLFSIVLWHHFAYLILSVALLGVGASGTAIALAGPRILARFPQCFVACCALAAVAMPASFLVAQRVAFNPLELVWDAAQPGRLAAICALLALPFFFAACAIGLALTRFGALAHRIYAFDILGAAAGSSLVVWTLFVLEPNEALLALGGLGMVAAAVAWRELDLVPRAGFEALLALSLWPLAVPAAWYALHLSPYKDLSQALRVSGARIVAERSGPLAALTVVEGTRIPFRHAPGLSLASPAETPPQLALFADGDALGAITRFDGRPENVAYLGYLTSALPYHLVRRPRVLVLGAGAGGDVLQAVALGASRVDAVEMNAQVAGLITGPYAAFAGGLYQRPDVRVHAQEARAYARSTRERYDVIQLALFDSFGTSSAGLYALAESALYTVEGLEDYLARLAPEGLLAITRWASLPPRDSLKLFATAIAALERRGVREPGRRMVLVRGWKTATLVIKNGDLAPGEIEAARRFCTERSFDVEWYPGISPSEINRYNILERAWHHEAAVALLGPGRNDFIARYKFHIEPATDDRPYFFRFFRWSSAAEFIALKDVGGLALLEWGYPVLVLTLAIAIAAGALLILAPAAFSASLRGSSGRGRVALHFLAIGLAFMFLEIAFIQKLMLFLGHPLYAVAVALCAFLAAAAAGSRLAERLAPARRLPLAVMGIALVCAIYVVALPGLLGELAALGDAAKIAISLVLIAPLGLCMGVPFPTGLAALARADSRLVPWAWAVNGCASVAGVGLATLLALHWGFTAVVGLAVVLYAIAWASQMKGRTPYSIE